MTYKPISTLFPIRRRIRSRFVPLHSPDSPDSAYSPDSLIFFLIQTGTCTPQREIYPERLKFASGLALV
jgi:hypothetical protein